MWNPLSASSFSIYILLVFPAPVPLSTYHGGRVAETEWGPFRGSATQNWFEECSKKTEKLQISFLSPFTSSYFLVTKSTAPTDRDASNLC